MTRCLVGIKMEMFVIIILMFGLIGADNPPQCTRNVVYQVTNLHQDNCCSRDRCTDCTEEALINGENLVRDNQLSASSTHAHCSLSWSRLHTENGAWCALTSADKQWIQVNFGRNVLITAIALQGRNNVQQWVTSYTLSVSNDGLTWRPYTAESAIRIFGGNWDTDTVNKNYLKRPVTTRFLRLHPKTWNNHISLRWEVYGCSK